MSDRSAVIGFEIYGTEGSAAWNFEQMNELRICLGRGGPHFGYTTVLGNSHLGDYAHFQPGPGTSMGHDDLKVIEAKKFLVAVTGGERRNSTVDDAHHVAEVIAAAAASSERGTWQQVPAVPAADIRRRPGHTRHGKLGEVVTVDRPVVVALGPVEPALVAGVLGEEIAFVADPSEQHIANAAGAIVRADAVVDAAFLARAPRLRVLARTGVGVDHVDLQAATARGIPVVITPGSGTQSCGRGVFALALHLVKRLRPFTDLVRHGRWADRGQVSMGDLDGATIGIIGYGRIGRRVGELATAFGMNLLAYDPFSAPPPEIAVCRPVGARLGERRRDAARTPDRRNPSPGRQVHFWIAYGRERF